ncbi:hypothetical protein ACFY2K_10640 [Kitasatospora sp. NPDC001309]|uniref:hypothetical protein n=1 Tax=Kitasatospora sp. NPDC001309 TaxID=3364013 RepID=UPI0036D20352
MAPSSGSGNRRRRPPDGRDPGALRLVLRVNPVVTAGPAPEGDVPQRGTVAQIAHYLASAVRELGAEPLIDLHHAARSPEEFLSLAREFRDALALPPSPTLAPTPATGLNPPPQPDRSS